MIDKTTEYLEKVIKRQREIQHGLMGELELRQAALRKTMNAVSVIMGQLERIQDTIKTTQHQLDDLQNEST